MLKRQREYNSEDFEDLNIGGKRKLWLKPSRPVLLKSYSIGSDIQWKAATVMDL